ncbi:transcription elongation factor GreAB [Verrucomicrobiaceae bacterium N1E253]|uniref:Transcription elongation factor GreAB n=1 Tax=Oceaniferula marina TaxID=2748318 RepID=A0A851G9D8_9BACT|nr:transcription elongation factor GreAB [Oceaniferula marina]NWK54223.1 transcription elongation factor GreAB [Oceaniferula marina]
MDKQAIVDQLCAQLRRQWESMTEAAKSTHHAATGEESKQEGKYDTRGLEASYLAEAQAEQAQQLARSLHALESMVCDAQDPGSEISPGSLVELEQNGEWYYFLLTPSAGGLTIPYEGGELVTLSPEAPLYQQLLGCRAGDLIPPDDLIVLDVQ